MNTPKSIRLKLEMVLELDVLFIEVLPLGMDVGASVPFLYLFIPLSYSPVHCACRYFSKASVSNRILLLGLLSSILHAM